MLNNRPAGNFQSVRIGLQRTRTVHLAKAGHKALVRISHHAGVLAESSRKGGALEAAEKLLGAAIVHAIRVQTTR
jgi:hypothetical protein